MYKIKIENMVLVFNNIVVIIMMLFFIRFILSFGLFLFMSRNLVYRCLEDSIFIYLNVYLILYCVYRNGESDI